LGAPAATSRRVPVICFVGHSGAGKTTLIERLIPALKVRGYRVGTIKRHAHPGFEIDRPGKDTWRHAQAGSDHVVIAAPDKVASIRRVECEPTLEELVVGMNDVDIVLAEGFKRTGTWRIEIVRAGHSREPLCSPEEVIAWVTDLDLPAGAPIFGLEDVSSLVDFIEGRFLRT
jgi:molybdopterin-guanine dinucleotide biosynthesis adapter protein